MHFELLIILSVLLGYSQAAWNVTCDFDLEGIENIVEYLPSECIEIYRNGKDSELYQASLAESRGFADFYKKLERYERRQAGSPKPNELPNQNTKLRFHIYNTTLLNNCAVDIGNRPDLTTDDDRTNKYYECLSLKREQMIKLIPK